MAQQKLDNGLEIFEYDPDADFDDVQWQEEEPQQDAEGRVLEHEVYQDGDQLVASRAAWDALVQASMETQYYSKVPYDDQLRADWVAGYRVGLPTVVGNIERNILSDEKWRHLDGDSLHRLGETYEQMLNPQGPRGNTLDQDEVRELQVGLLDQSRTEYESHIAALHYLAEVQAGYLTFDVTVAEYAHSQHVIEMTREQETRMAVLGTQGVEMPVDVSRSKDQAVVSAHASLDEVKLRFEAFRQSELQERTERGRQTPDVQEQKSSKTLDELRQRLRGVQVDSTVEHEDEGMEF